MTYHQDHFGDLLIRINKLRLLMITSGSSIVLAAWKPFNIVKKWMNLLYSFNLKIND